MGKINSLLGRGIRYIQKNGITQLYRKVRERRLQNQWERPYSCWLEKQQPDEAELEKQRRRQFAGNPKISVLVPAYETPPEFLCQVVDSLTAQTYADWELCIADGSRSCQVEETLAPYLQRDSRIRYQRLSQNLGISENTNAALAMATGDWVGLLDHDDLLFPHTLYRIAEAMEENPRAEAFYTDEDKVSFDLKQHFQPHFKPDFNRELLRSNNYICHFFVVKRSIAASLGGFSSEFDGAQDYDFILRCTEQAEEVCHIPEILYSWRCHPSSTAANPESKLYAYEAGKRAVAAHLRRCGEAGQVLDTSNYGFYRVRYERPEPFLIKSFEKFNGQNDENVVYYDKACNKIVTFPKKDVTDGYVLFSCIQKGRPDPGFWEELEAVCRRPDVGIACARVYGKNGRLSHPVEMAGVRDPFGRTVQGLKKGYLGYFHRACLQQEIVRPTDVFLMRGELFAELVRLYQTASGQQCFSAEQLQPAERPEKPEGQASWQELLAQQVRRMGYRVVYDPWAVLYEEE